MAKRRRVGTWRKDGSVTFLGKKKRKQKKYKMYPCEVCGRLERVYLEDDRLKMKGDNTCWICGRKPK